MLKCKHLEDRTFTLGGGSGRVCVYVCMHVYACTMPPLLNNRSIKTFKTQSKQRTWQFAYATMGLDMMLRT